MSQSSHSPILILTDMPLGWSTDYPNQTAWELARHGYDVSLLQLFSFPSLKNILIDAKPYRPVTRDSKGLLIFTPFQVLPMKRFRIIQDINIWIAIIIWYLWYITIHPVYLFHPMKPILWFFTPHVAIPSPMKYLFRFLYDAVDYLQVSHLEEKALREAHARKRNVIENSNFVFVNSRTLLRLYRPYRRDIHLVPQGFRLDTFQRISTSPPFRIPKTKPIVGYIGGINYRLDFKLLTKVIPSCPQVLFVFVGPILQDFDVASVRIRYRALKKFSNVRIYPEVPKEDVPGVIAQFTIGMIPYDISYPVNRYCYPMKLFEYFYLGKPVIATPIEELKQFPQFVILGATSDDWTKRLKKLIRHSWTKKKKEKMKHLAVQNSWNQKIQTIIRIILCSH